MTMPIGVIPAQRLASIDALRALDGERCLRLQELAWQTVCYAVRLGEEAERQYAILDRRVTKADPKGLATHATQLADLTVAIGKAVNTLGKDADADHIS